MSSEDYRYGFNGKENDNEVKGKGNQQDYGMRIYDPRFARFLSVDPLTKQFPFYTPYQFAGNKPIYAIDLDGCEDFSYINWMIDVIVGISKLKKVTNSYVEANMGTGDFNNSSIPKETRNINNHIVQGNAIKTYSESFVGLSEYAVEGIGSIPGIETVGDLVLTTYYGLKGDNENALAYAAGLALPLVSGKIIKELKGPLHHLFTNKNFLRGQQWSNKFLPMFEKAGYNLNAAINKINVPGHKGPHPDDYHDAVYNRLKEATEGLDGEDYKVAFDKTLEELKKEVNSEGSKLNKLLTKVE